MYHKIIYILGTIYIVTLASIMFICYVFPVDSKILEIFFYLFIAAPLMVILTVISGFNGRLKTDSNKQYGYYLTAIILVLGFISFLSPNWINYTAV